MCMYTLPNNVLAIQKIASVQVSLNISLHISKWNLRKNAQRNANLAEK